MRYISSYQQVQAHKYIITIPPSSYNIVSIYVVLGCRAFAVCVNFQLQYMPKEGYKDSIIVKLIIDLLESRKHVT